MPRKAVIVPNSTPAIDRTIQSLYEEYADILSGYFKKKLRTNDENEDLVQGVFIRIYNRIQRGDDIGVKDRSYVFTVAHSVLIDHIRKKKTKHQCISRFNLESMIKKDDGTEYSEHLLKDDITPERILSDRQRLNKTISILLNTPHLGAKLLFFYNFYGLSLKETGKLIGRSSTSGRHHMSRYKATKEFAQLKDGDFDAITFANTGQRGEYTMPDIPVLTDEPEKREPSKPQQSILDKAEILLCRMPKIRRKVLMMREQEKMSFKTIADNVNLSQRAVMKQHKLGMATINKHF